VISSEDVYFFRVLNFISEQKTYRLDSLSSPVNIVSEEKIVGFGREAAILKESEHVVVLSMNIPTYFERRLSFNEHGLTEKNIFDGPNDAENHRLLKFD
jgi:hypothetical protein